MPAFISFRRLLPWLLCAALAGCASNGPPLAGLPDRVELNSVPFYRGTNFQGGSNALAGLLVQQGITITPGLLEADLHLPQDVEHLQAAIPVAARQYGMLVYPLDPTLQALLVQVAAGYPVLVRYSDGSVWSEPRYSIVVGFDRFKKRVLLRSGNSRRLPMDFDSFASAWKSSGSWAILVQAPTQLPAQVDRQRWLKAAEELARAGQEQAAARAVKAAGAQ